MKLARRERQERGALAPFGELNRIRSEINRIFEDPFALMTRGTGFLEAWEPAVDIYEDKDQFTVKAELPGLKKEEIDVALHGNTLTIAGERKQEQERKEGDTYRSERYFGRFQRNITLSAPVDSNKIQASYKDGVLTIVLPKSEEAKAKQIQIKT